MPLYRPSELALFIKQLKKGVQKSLSQNFLIDGNILNKILLCAEVSAQDLIIEIGPGPGVLTEALLATGAEVIAIEKDPPFASHLNRLKGNLTVYEADILSFPLTETLQDRKAKVVSNLPYHITTPILQKLLPMQNQISTLTLMVQRELGERLVASPNSVAYSSLTLFVRYYAKAHFCFMVKPQSFYPCPKVDSCVVSLELHGQQGNVPPEQFFSITRRAFQQRRKMLRVSLKGLFTTHQIEEALQALQISPQARPEQLSYEEFTSLAQRLYQ